jgi:hypothetical protein
MCYEALIGGDAAERPLASLVREEWADAGKDGAVAAAVVFAVLLAEGTGVALVAGATVGAFVLGVALHQAVLLAGVALLRWRAGSPAQAAETA